MNAPATLRTDDLLRMGAAYNPRTMPDAEMLALRKSLRQFGPVQPIVLNRRTADEWGTGKDKPIIVGGHQRVRAASAEGIGEMPVVWVDLGEVEEKSLNLALNRIHGAWDQDLLGKLLLGLREAKADMGGTGFDDTEIGRLLATFRAKKKGETEPDDVPPVPDAPRTRHGEIVTLGNHRIMCGDSTNGEMVGRLFAGSLADCMWTDPPYGVEYEGKTKEKLRIQNDGSDGLMMLLFGAFEKANMALRANAPIYVAHPAGPLSMDFYKVFVSMGWVFRQALVWVKDVFVLGHSDYHYRHEPLIYGSKPGPGRFGRGTDTWYGGNSEDSVLEVPRPKFSKEHPTMKPVELIEKCIMNSVAPGDLVYDPFLGSGTTLIACEKTGRRCYGMELDRRFVDVIVTRWENFTGGKAERNTDGCIDSAPEQDSLAGNAV